MTEEEIKAHNARMRQKGTDDRLKREAKEREDKRIESMWKEHNEIMRQKDADDQQE